MNWKRSVPTCWLIFTSSQILGYPFQWLVPWLFFIYHSDNVSENDDVRQKAQGFWWTDRTRVNIYVYEFAVAGGLHTQSLHVYTICYVLTFRIARLTNTCYIGQTLQLLLHIPALKVFLESPFPDGTMEAALKKLFSSFYEDSDEPLSISAFFEDIIASWKPLERKNNTVFAHSCSLCIVLADAQEFFSWIWNNIDSDSRIHDLYSCHQRATFTCQVSMSTFHLINFCPDL